MLNLVSITDEEFVTLPEDLPKTFFKERTIIPFEKKDNEFFLNQGIQSLTPSEYAVGISIDELMGNGLGVAVYNTDGKRIPCFFSEQNSAYFAVIPSNKFYSVEVRKFITRMGREKEWLRISKFKIFEKTKVRSEQIHSSFLEGRDYILAEGFEHLADSIKEALVISKSTSF